MNVTQEIEDKLNLNIDDLNAIEKETYYKMLETVQKSQMTPEKMKEYISSMREAITQDLVNEPEFNYVFVFRIANRKQVMLKARLHNYLLLESFLDSPKKAQQALEDMIGNIGK